MGSPLPPLSEGDIEKPVSEGRKVVRWVKPSPLEYPALTIKAFMVVRPSDPPFLHLEQSS
jgi:hypothetical protein